MSLTLSAFWLKMKLSQTLSYRAVTCLHVVCLCLCWCFQYCLKQECLLLTALTRSWGFLVIIWNIYEGETCDILFFIIMFNPNYSHYTPGMITTHVSPSSSCPMALPWSRPLSSNLASSSLSALIRELTLTDAVWLGHSQEGEARVGSAIVIWQSCWKQHMTMV